MTNPCPASRSSDLFGQHFLSIGIPFIDLAFAILARLDGIVERGLNLLRGLHVLNSHGADLNSRLVFIEQFLDSFLDGRRHFGAARIRSEEHTSELQSLMRISYAVICLKKKR